MCRTKETDCVIHVCEKSKLFMRAYIDAVCTLHERPFLFCVNMANGIVSYTLLHHMGNAALPVAVGMRDVAHSH